MNAKLKTLLIINSLMIVSGNLLGPLYAIFAESINATAFEVSLSWAIMLATGIITSLIVAGFIKDNTRRNVYLVTIGYVISALSWSSYLIVSNVEQLLIVQAILGVGLAIGTAPFNALFAEHLDDGKHVHDYAGQQIIGQVIKFVAVLTGGMILTAFGFEVLFVVMASLTLLAAVAMISLPMKYFEVKS